MVGSKIAEKCLIQLSYAIGVVDPISIFLEVDNNLDLEKKNRLIQIINENFDLSPSGIKNFLRLDSPIYQETAAYGHFGREYNKTTGSFSWESLESIEVFKKSF
ncbi:MAG: hypothetical protein CNE97_00360 [alpha proteobacterium MED-G10]|nr:MAG: hypothetical protein CNE97_00360 [alpha proteobacterium MED-G10]